MCSFIRGWDSVRGCGGGNKSRDELGTEPRVLNEASTFSKVFPNVLHFTSSPYLSRVFPRAIPRRSLRVLAIPCSFFTTNTLR
ncbi:hypothetical protein PAXRUDRAFT_631509 [Paxillus rubicundulus Ve08.2h10]|uniref:Uncharacterized protein n=1 Tax=Paxillus rubicundulus Ve08.2h10 TaxID=930991 RepID=A0A0D0DJZ9_9AGAM|nr:hypothetical protein PAXRUDRAFT_631509 [Paxillus rubicundulus Ve08.2h10]